MCNYSLLNFSILIVFLGHKVQTLTNENIIGGELTEITSYPYHAYVSISNDLCNGVIINERHIITAAHCVANELGQFENKNVRIVVGAHNFIKNCVSRLEAKAVVVYLHKNFHPEKSFENDIAVIKLNIRIPIDDYFIGKVKLPEPFVDADLESYVDTKPIFTGFGANSKPTDDWDGHFNGKAAELSGNLYFSRAIVLPSEECLMTYYTYNHVKRFFCSQLERSEGTLSKGTCQGDSGGPLVLKMNGEDTLIGILSGGDDDCDDNIMPSVYVRISYYRDFIDCAISKTLAAKTVCSDMVRCFCTTQWKWINCFNGLS
ncbi:CUB and peptidase domain-containing protein 1-like [Copidosoma floridanum]|uniref:CUB and peptidase domain-containing protein 1-like n=1 Tax=Copidosoma floridanum TaxID=29053 RepID=UPI0006C9CC83|nr:CUB and peptidase domain-containing protein 1-like [Copidosoma floridanum]